MLAAQESAPSPRPLFVDAVQKGLQAPQTVRLPASPDTQIPGQEMRRLGVTTLLAPDWQTGEVVRVEIPVGALTVRIADTLGNARRERAKRKAGERVQRDLDAFLAQQQKK
jgi:hypothetical protein